MGDSTDLTELAQKCRRLAAAMTDAETRAGLEALACHYEAQQRAAEQEHAARPEQPAPKPPMPRE